MEKGLVKIYFGEGKGKSTSSMGRALVCAGEEKEVFVIQFLKGKMTGSLDYLKRLEPEIKVFRFEREEAFYEDLSDEEKQEEKVNILNGYNFAKKVLSIGECDVLILDEILGLVDLGIITCEDVIRLIDMKDESVELIMTGRHLPEELIPYADYISRLDIVKGACSEKPSCMADNLLLAGIFLASCFISLSIGTSVGTIVALTPVAAGIAMKTDVSLPFMTALVIGGAFFGDNLSFISDTTIAATRTQGCVMRDKFRVNFLIAVPAALLVFIYYIIYGTQVESASEIHAIEWGKVIPYLIVLGTAIAGMNVTLVLLLGVLSTGIIGCIYGSFDLFGWFASMGEGITGMGELIIITLMAGGMLELIRFNGGVDYILHHLTRHVSNKRGAELSIAALVSLANFCTANNTIAIITVGPLANNIAEQFRVDKRKSASILDTFSCVVQGLIPYGAQMLIAAELTKLSPISIIGYLYYPIILGIVALLSILLRYPKRYS